MNDEDVAVEPAPDVPELEDELELLAVAPLEETVAVEGPEVALVPDELDVEATPVVPVDEMLVEVLVPELLGEAVVEPDEWPVVPAVAAGVPHPDTSTINTDAADKTVRRMDWSPLRTCSTSALFASQANRTLIYW